MTYFECVEHFRMQAEEKGLHFDFIDNPYTGSQFVVINGHRAKVRGCGAATPASEIYTALRDACNEAWKNWRHSNLK